MECGWEVVSRLSKWDSVRKSNRTLGPLLVCALRDHWSGSRKPLRCFLLERLFAGSSSLRNANKAMIHLSHRVSTSSKWQWVMPAVCPFACYRGLPCSVFLWGMPASLQTALSSPMWTGTEQAGGSWHRAEARSSYYSDGFPFPSQPLLPSSPCSALESMDICQDWALLKHLQSYCGLERNASSNSGPAVNVGEEGLLSQAAGWTAVPPTDTWNSLQPSVSCDILSPITR